MIKVTQLRKSSRAPSNDFDYGSFSFSPMMAWRHLINSELKWRAKIIEIMPTKIISETRFMSWIDTVKYECSDAAQFEPLFLSTSFYLKAIMDGCFDLANRNSADEIIKISHGKALFITALGPMLAGENLVKLTAMFGAGLIEEKEYETGMRLQLDDLLAVLTLRNENPKMAFADIVSMAS